MFVFVDECQGVIKQLDINYNSSVDDDLDSTTMINNDFGEEKLAQLVMEKVSYSLNS